MSGSSRDLAYHDPCDHRSPRDRDTGASAHSLHLAAAAALAGTLACAGVGAAEAGAIAPPSPAAAKALVVSGPAARVTPPAPVAPRAHAARHRGCADANLMPNPSDLGRVEAATLCLINIQRVRAGLAPLRNSARLGRAASDHSRDMTVRDYFDHNSPTGSSLLSRLAGVGFVHPKGSYDIGENLGWGTGHNATPASEVSMWMHSAGHRANILYAPYRHSGVGVSPGVPRRSAAGSAGATYTQDFGA